MISLSHVIGLRHLKLENTNLFSQSPLIMKCPQLKRDVQSYIARVGQLFLASNTTGYKGIKGNCVTLFLSKEQKMLCARQTVSFLTY